MITRSILTGCLVTVGSIVIFVVLVTLLIELQAGALVTGIATVSTIAVFALVTSRLYPSGCDAGKIEKTKRIDHSCVTI